MGHWVNWSCLSGDVVKAGVYDTLTKKQFAFPQIDGALRLGDGCIVNRVADGGLALYDFHSGTVVKRQLAEHTGTAWSLDPYTGYVAYSDADQNVRILNVGVSASALSVADVQVGTTVDTDSTPWDGAASGGCRSLPLRGSWWSSTRRPARSCAR